GGTSDRGLRQPEPSKIKPRPHGASSRRTSRSIGIESPPSLGIESNRSTRSGMTFLDGKESAVRASSVASAGSGHAGIEGNRRDGTSVAVADRKARDGGGIIAKSAGGSSAECRGAETRGIAPAIGAIPGRRRRPQARAAPNRRATSSQLTVFHQATT